MAWTFVALAFSSFVPRMYLRMMLPEGNDLMVYLASARALLRGGNPYWKGDVPQGHGPYPLTVDVLVIPLTWLPLWVAEAVWFTLSAAALLGALAILDGLWIRAVPAAPVTRRVPFSVRLAAVVAIFFVPLQSHFTFGQLNLMILLVCCLYLRAQLDGREDQAAMWLGGGIALKLIPGVFLAGLVATRKVRTLLVTGAWTIALAVAVPALVSRHVLAFYGGWWLDRLRQHADAPVAITWRTRFSLGGMLVRVWPDLGGVPGLSYWLAAIVLAPIVTLHLAKERDARTALTLFALYLAAIPLISPISEMHHLTLLIASLWLWFLAAGSPPYRPAFDAIGVGVVVAVHWIGIARNRSVIPFLTAPPRPGGRRTGSLFEGGAVLLLYVILLIRAHLDQRRRGESRRP